MGYDTTLAKEVPRSIATYLGAKVTLLEEKIRAVKEQQRQKQRTFAMTDCNLVTNPGPNLGELLTTALTDTVDVHHDLNFNVTGNMSPYYHSFHLQQSRLPLPFPPQSQYPARDEAAGRLSPQPLHPSSIPRDAADLMFRNYVEVHLIRHPCLEEDEILESYGLCLDNPETATPYDVFIVCMALAISAATLIWRDEKHALAASAGFFAKAKQMLTLFTVAETEIQKIQVALLLTHYALINPSGADPWYCIGDASRQCINLGLHKEADPQLKLGPREVNTRRRLFWTTCGLERTICCQMRQPFLFDESSITTQLYSDLAEERIFPGRSVEEQLAKLSGHYFLHYRFLETEVYNILWSSKPQHTSVQLEGWIVSFNQRIIDWYSRAVEIGSRPESLSEPEGVLELCDLGLFLIRSKLYRPTPRVKYPSREDLVQYIRAVQGITDHYIKYCQHRRLIYPWFAGHNLFEISVVTLHTSWFGSNWLSDHVNLDEVMSCIRDQVSLLREVALYWPAIKACADTIASLAEPVLSRLDTIGRAGPLEELARDPATSDLLDWYLFPDSALQMDRNIITGTFDDLEWLNMEETLLGGWEDVDWSIESNAQGLFF